jgi:hypothetical protein
MLLRMERWLFWVVVLCFEIEQALDLDHLMNYQ